MSNELLKIKEIVINKPNEKIENLARIINKELLKECHAKMDKNKATGVDNMSKEEYEQNLNDNLDKLIDRMKKGSYKPQPAKRVYIRKMVQIRCDR